MNSGLESRAVTNHFRTFGLVLPALVGGTLAGCASSPDLTRPYEIRPLTSDGAPASRKEIVIERTGVRIVLEALGDEERSRWLSEVAAIPTDPLLTRAGDKDFVTFRLRVEASGPDAVNLESQAIRIWSPDGKISGAPLDYTRAYEILRPDIESAPDAADLRKFMKGLIDGPVHVASGRFREGLLVFPEPPAEMIEMILELSFVHVGTSTHQIKIPLIKVFDAEEEPHTPRT